MVNKKKYLGFLKSLFLLSFIVFLGGFSTICKATDEDYQLTASQLNEICSITGATTISGDVQVTFLNTFNQWARTMQARSDFDWFNYDIVFYPAGQNAINWVLNPTSNTSDLYITTLNSTTTSATIYGFSNWNYDANNNVTGFTSKSITRYAISYYSPNQITTSNFTNQAVTLTTNGFTITANSIGTYDVYSDTNKYIIWEPHIGKTGFTTIYGYNNTGLGYTSFRFTNTLSGGGSSPSPTPTSIPSGGGGGGTTDLTQTNNLISEVNNGIDDVNDNLTSYPSSGDLPDISSGDIVDTLGMAETADPYENFWASFINGLNTALTCPNNTTFDIEIFGKEYTIDSSEWAINYPEPLRYILVIACTIGIVFAELKMWRKIIISINTGNLMNLASSYSNDDITDLF